MSDARPFWRTRLVPALAALLGANLLLLVAWTGPRYWRERGAAARSEAARAEVARQRAATVALRERAAAIRANGVDLERFYRSLAGTEKADLLPTLTAVEELARAPGLRPGGRSYKREEVPDARVERVAVTLPLEGTYSQLVSFLREVERSPRFLTVDRVALRGDDEGAATLQVELSTYLRLAPGASKEARGGRS